MEGKIIKGIAGFYYVHTPDGGCYACKARGIFRKEKKTPLVGDDVVFEVTHEGDREGNILSIRERRSQLYRPAVANIDSALVIFAVKDPEPNLNLLDRFLITMGRQGLPVSIFFNKADLDSEGRADEWAAVYEKAGYRVLKGSALRKETLELLQPVLSGKTVLLAGPSGVGKSTLSNLLLGREHMEVGSLSEKIRRGKQTTRHTELLALGGGSFLLDTPGFTSLELRDIPSEELRDEYPEFAEAGRGCRYAVCSHVNEDRSICRVKQEVLAGSISRLRYNNYRQLYLELKAEERRY